MKALTRTIALVNNVPILIIENGQKLVPIKPICEALGIAPQSQVEKLKQDEILSSVTMLSIATGADGKTYEMTCIPFKFVFGWLFTINPKNVKPEAQDLVRLYKLKCYEVLYQNFTDHTEFLEQKQVALQDQMDKVQQEKETFRNAKNTLKAATDRLNAIKDQSFDEWLSNNRQLKLEFEPAVNEEDQE